jgi:23S rRNA (uracil1939-C5)-methyltransferase
MDSDFSIVVLNYEHRKSLMKKHKEPEIVELTIESLGFEGKSIARLDGKVIFVKGGLPGDKVIAEIRKSKKKHSEAVIREIIEPSLVRREPVCGLFGECGGCSWQQCQYQEQLRWKEQTVVDCFERLGKIDYGERRSIIGSPQEFNYRNKMEFTFSNKRWLTNAEVASGKDYTDKGFALGLHAPGRFDAVLDVSHCYIQPQVGNDILSAIRNKALALGVHGYNSRSHEGFLRNLVIRTTLYQNQLMIILVTNEIATDEERLFTDWFTTEFCPSFDGLTSAFHAINSSRSPVAIGKIEYQFGLEYITEESHDVVYRISPFSFFQTNSYQLENFLTQTLLSANVQPDNTVWDLYCGTGSISLPLAKNTGHVVGVELVESSIADAKVNAELNSITNVEFHCADLHKQATLDFLKTLPQPDIIVVDPPRAGIHEQTLRHILALAPERICYVSCNPATQARDCALLDEAYRVEYIQPIDMFPHTFHVENVARLVRR